MNVPDDAEISSKCKISIVYLNMIIQQSHESARQYIRLAWDSGLPAVRSDIASGHNESTDVNQETQDK